MNCLDDHADDDAGDVVDAGWWVVGIGDFVCGRCSDTCFISMLNFQPCANLMRFSRNLPQLLPQMLQSSI